MKQNHPEIDRKDKFVLFKSTQSFPSDLIPKDPRLYYTRKGDWVSWGDFLGTGNTRAKPFLLDYESAKTWLRSNKPAVATYDDYCLWKLQPGFPVGLLPKFPSAYYERRGTWRGWGDFLGNGNYRYKSSPGWLGYETAKAWLRKHKPDVCSQETWRDWVRTDNFPHVLLPKNPSQCYKLQGTWISWLDFLGKPPARKRRTVYIHRHPLFPGVKIGIETRKNARLISANINDPYRRFERIFEVEFSDGREAEKILHSLFADKRISGEWFNVEGDEAIRAIEAALEVIEGRIL